MSTLNIKINPSGAVIGGEKVKKVLKEIQLEAKEAKAEMKSFGKIKMDLNKTSVRTVIADIKRILSKEKFFIKTYLKSQRLKTDLKEFQALIRAQGPLVIKTVLEQTKRPVTGRGSAAWDGGSSGAGWYAEQGPSDKDIRNSKKIVDEWNEGNDELKEMERRWDRIGKELKEVKTKYKVTKDILEDMHDLEIRSISDKKLVREEIKKIKKEEALRSNEMKEQIALTNLWHTVLKRIEKTQKRLLILSKQAENKRMFGMSEAISSSMSSINTGETFKDRKEGDPLFTNLAEFEKQEKALVKAEKAVNKYGKTMDRTGGLLNTKFGSFSIIMSGIAATIFVFQSIARGIQAIIRPIIELEQGMSNLKVEISKTAESYKYLKEITENTDLSGTLRIKKQNIST